MLNQQSSIELNQQSPMDKPQSPICSRQSAILVLLLVHLLTDAGVGQAQTFDRDVSVLVEKISPQAIALRQQIHQNPELSNREVKTAEMVAKRLRDLGYQVKTGI